MRKAAVLGSSWRALTADDYERSRSSRSRDARSPADPTLSSSLVTRAGRWALPRHRRGVANTEFATAADDQQERTTAVLLVDECESARRPDPVLRGASLSSKAGAAPLGAALVLLPPSDSAAAPGPTPRRATADRPCRRPGGVGEMPAGRGACGPRRCRAALAWCRCPARRQELARGGGFRRRRLASHPLDLVHRLVCGGLARPTESSRSSSARQLLDACGDVPAGARAQQMYPSAGTSPVRGRD
jgi:hypothetical protein